MKNPLISVVIPLYNKEKTIKNTILSVLNQTVDNYEIIVVNDGSTDNSLEIVNEILEPKLKIYSKKNEGVSTARNYGINKSIGQFILFLDADDLLNKEAINTYNNLIEKYSNISIFTTNFSIANQNGIKKQYCIEDEEKLIKNAYKDIYNGNIYPRTGNTIIKKTCFNKVGLYNEKLTKYEDFEFNIRLFGKYELVYSNIDTFTYNGYESELSKKEIKLYKEYISIINLDDNFYKSLLLTSHILSYIIYFLSVRDYISLFKIFKKNKEIIFYLPIVIGDKLIKSIKK